MKKYKFDSSRYKELFKSDSKENIVAMLKLLLEKEEMSTLDLKKNLNIGYATTVRVIDKLYFAGMVSRPGSDWYFDDDKEILKPIRLILDDAEKQKVQEHLDQIIF